MQFHSFDLNTVFLFMSFQCIHLFIYFIHCIHVIPVIYSLISFILFISFLSFIHILLSFYSSHSCHLFTYFFHAALLFISYLFVANLLGIFCNFHRFDLKHGFPFHIISFIPFQSFHLFIHLLHLRDQIAALLIY